MSDWMDAKGGPGIGQYPKVVAAAFSDDVLEGGNNSEPVEIEPNDVVVVRVEERENAYADHPYSVIVIDESHPMAQAAWERCSRGNRG